MLIHTHTARHDTTHNTLIIFQHIYKTHKKKKLFTQSTLIFYLLLSLVIVVKGANKPSSFVSFFCFLVIFANLSSTTLVCSQQKVVSLVSIKEQAWGGILMLFLEEIARHTNLRLALTLAFQGFMSSKSSTDTLFCGLI